MESFILCPVIERLELMLESLRMAVLVVLTVLFLASKINLLTGLDDLLSN